MYQIKILTDEEFEALPYEEVAISLGVADTNTGTAYVRHVASDELQKYLINHELEHLMGEDRDELHHDGNGIYYKGFGNVIQGLGQAASGAGRSIGGAVQSVGQAAGGAAKSIGQGISKTAGALNPMNLFKPQGAQSQAPGPALPNVKPPTSSRPLFQPNQAMPKLPNPSQGLSANATINPLLRMPLGQQSTQGAPPTPSFGGKSFQLPSIQGPQPLFSSSQPATPSQPMTPSIGGNNAGGAISTGDYDAKPLFSTSDLFKGVNMGQVAMGQAMNMFGQNFAPKQSDIRVPDVSQLPSVQRLSNFKPNSYAELDPALKEAVIADLSRIDEQEMRELRNRYHNLRPGADIESDSAFRKDIEDLQHTQSQRQMRTLAEYRLKFAQNSLQASDMEMRQLAGLAQADIDQIMAQTTLDYNSAMEFKKLFGGIGGQLIGQGLGLKQPSALEQTATEYFKKQMGTV